MKCRPWTERVAGKGLVVKMTEIAKMTHFGRIRQAREGLKDGLTKITETTEVTRTYTSYFHTSSLFQWMVTQVALLETPDQNLLTRKPKNSSSRIVLHESEGNLRPQNLREMKVFQGISFRKRIFYKVTYHLVWENNIINASIIPIYFLRCVRG